MLAIRCLLVMMGLAVIMILEAFGISKSQEILLNANVLMMSLTLRYLVPLLAHVTNGRAAASDATGLCTLLAKTTTNRAAASDATGLNTLLVKATKCRAAASDVTGLSPLLASFQFPTNVPTDAALK